MLFNGEEVLITDEFRVTLIKSREYKKNTYAIQAFNYIKCFNQG